MEELTAALQSEEQRPGIKLLIVDDREDNLLSIETILEKDNYVVRKANSGRAALKILLKEHDFTLILMDVQMPDLSGFDTAAMIYDRDKLKHIPIIFVTANDYGDENIFKGYQQGGVDYIYKPINPQLLRAKVGVFVELYQKNHQLMAQEQKLIAINKNLEVEIEERRISEERVRLLNRELLDNINRLKSTNDELERFAYVASHDLQEPLRKIIIFGNWLSDQYKHVLDKQGQDLLDRVIRSSERMKSLIKNLLAFSRSTHSVEGFEETELSAMVEAVVAELELYIEQKRAVFTISPLPKVPVMPVQFRQLFHNLIINSLKFSREDLPPEIHIGAEVVKGKDVEGLPAEYSGDDYYLISIRDNGIGFDEKYVEEIFKAFKRLHAFDKFEGTGIGLSICKKIMEKHNGFIGATSKIDLGATFTLTLPAKQPKAPQHDGLVGLEV